MSWHILGEGLVMSEVLNEGRDFIVFRKWVVFRFSTF
jgi:hypothetical protein